MKVSCDPEPLREGSPSALDLSVENTSSDQVLVLESATWEAPARGAHRWAKPALGGLRFEAGPGRYVLNTTSGQRAPLALQTGVLLPGVRARTFLPTAALTRGTCSATLLVRARSFPLSEFETRVYQSDEASASRPVQRFLLGPPPPAGQVRDAWVHFRGTSERLERLTLELEVTPDADDPADAALALVPASRLVGRVRRLKGAWVLEGADGALHLVRGQEALRCPPGTLDLATLEALDRARTQPLVAAILDVHIHEEESFALARAIRETPGNAEIPIAFASVDRSLPTRIAAFEAGGTKFFEKPISEESFGELVQHFVGLAPTQRGRLLIVDDDGGIRLHSARHLRAEGYFVEELASADTLLERLEQSHPDVLLLDVGLPRISGIDVCRALRMSERWDTLPILMVTAHVDVETRVAAFRAGATDVIAKPVLPEELLARVNVQVDRNRLLRERADKDALSGLMLRRPLLEALTREIARCDREGEPLALVLLDLDEFKKVNDTHGHLAGDQVIARLGMLLRTRFRIVDLRCRWGGEEFVLVFPGCGAESAAPAARRLLAEFSELRFRSEEGAAFGATFTAGVAIYPDDGRSVQALIRRADELLYEGKQAGRNRVTGSGLSPESPDPEGVTP